VRFDSSPPIFEEAINSRGLDLEEGQPLLAEPPAEIGDLGQLQPGVYPAEALLRETVCVSIHVAAQRPLA
jgi:hypothetical protein